MPSLELPFDETMEAIKRKIEEADEIADVTTLMINRNIPTKGCKTLQQMADRICKNLKDRSENLDPNKVMLVVMSTDREVASSHTPPGQLASVS